MKNEDRAATAVAIAKQAGALALEYFRHQDRLKVENKGHQDFVSQADREVEVLTRKLLAEHFPDDAIVGEEHAPTPGTSGFTWVIDPIDGTTNFVTSIPAWTVVIAGVENGRCVTGVIHDPCHDETFTAVRGQGAAMNGRDLTLSGQASLTDGSIGVGFSNRVDTSGAGRLASKLLSLGGVFHRNASGALSLAYVAAGRLLGYSEEHMNAWDCLAGQLIVEEAGGGVEVQDADRMIETGGRVIVGVPGVYEELVRLSDDAFKPRPSE